MKCIEILHNGERVCVAGHREAQVLEVGLHLAPPSAPELRASAWIGQPLPKSQMTWPKTKRAIAVGDKVELRITDELRPHAGQIVRSARWAKVYCSFCGKSQDEVLKLVAGPSVFICNECVEVCNQVLRAP